VDFSANPGFLLQKFALIIAVKGSGSPDIWGGKRRMENYGTF